MRNTKWMVLLTIGMLQSLAARADDALHLTDVRAAVYAPHWQLYHVVEATGYPDRWIRPIAEIEFQDNSVLGRVSKLRNLSLLTLAESGQTRLFLGVNDDGQVGLHFVVFHKNADERYLSLARMPYLRKKESRSDIR